MLKTINSKTKYTKLDKLLKKNKKKLFFLKDQNHKNNN